MKFDFLNGRALALLPQDARSEHFVKCKILLIAPILFLFYWLKWVFIVKKIINEEVFSSEEVQNVYF